MGLFTKKIKGENMIVEIEIKGEVPYPNATTRQRVYSKPLASLFKNYFNEVAVEYSKNKEGNLASIYVVGYDAKFSYKEEDKNVVLKKIFFTVKPIIENLFKVLNINAKLVGFAKSPFPTMVAFIGADLSGKKLNLIWLVRESVDFLILEFKGHGEAIKKTKELRDKLKKTKANVRLKPHHPNIIEVWVKKEKKWITLVYFTDPDYPYLEELTSSIKKQNL